MAEVPAGPVAAPVASSINLITREHAINMNLRANTAGHSWRMILQGDGSAGYVNLDHVAMVLNGASGEAVLVWPRPRVIRDALNVASEQQEISAPGMTADEVLGLTDPADPATQ